MKTLLNTFLEKKITSECLHFIARRRICRTAGDDILADKRRGSAGTDVQIISMPSLRMRERRDKISIAYCQGTLINPEHFRRLMRDTGGIIVGSSREHSSRERIPQRTGTAVPSTRESDIDHGKTPGHRS